MNKKLICESIKTTCWREDCRGKNKDNEERKIGAICLYDEKTLPFSVFLCPTCENEILIVEHKHKFKDGWVFVDVNGTILKTNPNRPRDKESYVFNRPEVLNLLLGSQRNNFVV